MDCALLPVFPNRRAVGRTDGRVLNPPLPPAGNNTKGPPGCAAPTKKQKTEGLNQSLPLGGRWASAHTGSDEGKMLVF